MCGKGGCAWRWACMVEGMCGRRGHVLAGRGRTCVAGRRGHVWQGAHVGEMGEMATAADGTHPTGMHSCSFFLQKMSCLLSSKNIERGSDTIRTIDLIAIYVVLSVQ